MRVYVAGRWTRKDEVRRVQQMLRGAGHEITHDWTQAEDPARDWPPAYVAKYLAEQASDDLTGVQDADVVVLLHDDTGRGLFVELGLALADSKRVIVVGAPCVPGTCIFYFLPAVEHVTDAVQVLALLAEEVVS